MAASAPVVTPPTRGEIRPCCIRNSPMARDESVMAAIEMAAERPTGALRGVCTHVRLSPFAWRRQCMPPECRQRHTSAGPLIFARTAGRYEGYWQDTAATAATARWASIEDWLVPCQQLCEVTSRRYRKSSCSSSSALSTARSGLTLAGAADATPAIHRCVRYRTLCSSHLSRGQHLRYRSPSENQTTLSDQETSMHPHGRGIARLRQFITCGWPTAFKTLLHQFLQFTFPSDHQQYGSNWIWFTVEKWCSFRIVVHSVRGALSDQFGT